MIFMFVKAPDSLQNIASGCHLGLPNFKAGLMFTKKKKKERRKEKKNKKKKEGRQCL